MTTVKDDIGAVPETAVGDWFRNRLGRDSAGQTAPMTAPLPQHLDGLDAQQWARSSPAERIQSLQRLENHFAGQQGRSVRPVVVDTSLSDRTYGVFGPKDNRLGLNPALVGKGSTPYRAMHTVLHEGRHAYQWDVVSGTPSPGVSQAQAQSWRDNYSAYNDPRTGPYHDYRFQPLEDDANRFAIASMEAESSHFAHDPGYQKFLKVDEKNTARLEKRATRARGADFRAEIAADISARANGSRSQGQQQSHGTLQGAVQQDQTQPGQAPPGNVRPGQTESRGAQRSRGGRGATMDRAAMSWSAPAAEGVGRPTMAQQVARRGARASTRGASLGGRGQ